MPTLLRAATEPATVALATVRFDHLDAMRGAAALLVLAGHLRAYIFLPFGELPHTWLSPVLEPFYFVTGLGHLAVLAFFALSGYLVGGKVLRDLFAGNFEWKSYLLRRLTRLWIVIVPVLMLTLALDRIGLLLTGGAGYDGRYHDLLDTGPPFVDHSLETLIGNIFFLQGIAVPVFGSDGPMWSLANEFWYYIVVPLAFWLLLSRRRTLKRLTGSIVLIGLLSLLPWKFWPGALIWLSGAAAAWSASVPHHAAVWRQPLVRGGCVVIFVAALLLTVWHVTHLPDLAFGLAVALCLPMLAHLRTPGDAYRRAALAGSQISYTLYLSHYPLITLILMTTLIPIRFAPGAAGFLFFFGTLLAALAWAVALWWCFERNTDRVYEYLAARLGIWKYVGSRSRVLYGAAVTGSARAQTSASTRS